MKFTVNLKRYLISVYLVSILIFLLFSAPASTVAQTGVHFGVHAGYNSIWILNQNNYSLSEMDYELKFGYMAGAAIGGMFEDRWGILAEVNLAKMGQDYRDGIGVPPVQSEFGTGQHDVYKEVNFTHVQIPLMVKYLAYGNATTRFFVQLGPQISILTAADLFYIIDDKPVSFDSWPGQAFPELAEPIDYFKDIEFGIAGGLGVEIHLGQGLYFNPAMRFYAGITDINQDVTRVALEYKGSRNAYWGLDIGVHYLIKTKNYNRF